MKMGKGLIILIRKEGQEAQRRGRGRRGRGKGRGGEGGKTGKRW